ncbi:glycosyltransferase family 4 protein [Methanocaldococcus sp.]|uniref:glycosyltransferase family 4 protein n=1 Tax=Methanocaldococcus sp. TaxID=2152917 RepID=UPI0026152A1A|nr:glycosyltransferase family 4 protein [Methanocaldococcus sp.]MCQ6254153.1 glycosyltransferase family 4 protein [Methanocaldococcus sp.]
MRIAMITWEYPPRIVGGLAIHCKGLAEGLARNGHKVDVITVGYDLPEYENINGVNVYRVKPISHPNFLTWTLFMAEEMEKKLGILGIDNYDVIHCHDWMTHFVGANLKHACKMPYVQSIHSTEIGRCGGLYSDDSRAIHTIEYLSTYESCQVITVSYSLKEEVCNIFKTPEDKVKVIYNGIDPWEFDIDMSQDEILNFRRSIGVQDDEKMILFVGRLTYQKGVEYLIRAIPKILEKHNVKLVIAGSGDMRNYLEDLSYQLNIRHKVIFLGFVSKEMLKKLYKSSDIVVIPSVYEPFGIVALEAMASGTPVVVSSVGGLKEIIKHEYNGVWVYPKNPDSIAWGVDRVLSDPNFRDYIVKNAKKDVYEKYSWDNIAKETVNVYKIAIEMMR